MQFQRPPDPILVKRSPDLQKLVEALSRQPQVAVDTEANSLYAYQERVCLIQFTIPGKDYLVDPLALDDISSLGTIFSNPEIEKIFHAAEYDLIILHHDFGFTFSKIFDTMLAARILGWKSVGLSSLLKSQFGVVVDKKYQRANWGQRPLPREMLTYAQLDTHYLISLREQMESTLKAKGRWQLAQDDFRRACHIHHSSHEKKTFDCWRINGTRELQPQQVAVLHELCQARDKIARSLDRPLFKVISDKVLLNVAEAAPTTLHSLERVPGVSRRQTHWIGEDLISAVQRGLKAAPPPPPHKPSLDETYLARVDQLRYWRKITARKMGVESDIILPKDLLYALADKNPKTQAEFEHIMKSAPWRLTRFGDELFKLVSNSGH